VVEMNTEASKLSSVEKAYISLKQEAFKNKKSTTNNCAIN
jgi:hypothetical protein